MTILRPIRPMPVNLDGLPAESQGHALVCEEWEGIAGDYEQSPEKLVHAWLYLGHHPAFWELGPDGGLSATGTAWGRRRCIEWGIAETEGGGTEVWLELQPHPWPGDPSDEEYLSQAPGAPSRALECAAPTLESALLLMASMAHERYGNDRWFMKIPQLEEQKWYG